METINDRVKLIIEREQMSVKEFAESINITDATIKHIINGRNNPSYDVMQKILSRYPYINSSWLLMGEGEMYKEEVSRENTNNSFGNVSLFSDENAFSSTERIGSSKNRKDLPLEKRKKEVETPINKEVIYQKSPERKVKEIRVFYDDGTYETFKPEKQ